MEKDHLEILLEDIRSKFDLVLEGHEVLRSEIQALARRTDERFDLVDLKFEALTKRVDEVETRLDAKIDGVEKKLEAKIDAVERKLEAKIDAVEKNLGGKLDAVAADLAAHRADTEAHHGVYRVKEP